MSCESSIIDNPTDGNDRRCIAWGLVIQQVLNFVLIPFVRPLVEWASGECRRGPLDAPWWTKPRCWLAVIVNVIVWVLVAVVSFGFVRVCRRWSEPEEPPAVTLNSDERLA